MRKIAIVNLRHNIKINDKTGEMKSPVFMLKLVNICKKLLTKNMRIFDTNFERLHLYQWGIMLICYSYALNIVKI